MSDPEKAGDKLVNSVALTLTARIAMVIATAALPIAGAMLVSVSQKIDAMRDQSFETNAALKLIQQTLIVQDKKIDDHEFRIRGVESFARMRP
jgi:hypothetical protein